MKAPEAVVNTRQLKVSRQIQKDLSEIFQNLCGARPDQLRPVRGARVDKCVSIR